MLDGAVLAGFDVYDDFSSGDVDPEKWYGIAERPILARSSRVVRQVENGQLRLALESFGETGITGGTAVARLGLGMLGLPPDRFIVGLSARVKIARVGATRCMESGEGDTGSSQARLVANLFNDGTSPGSENQIGDVIASLVIEHDTDGSRRILGSLVRSTVADGSKGVHLESPVLLGTWKVGPTILLKIVWDRNRHRVNFTAGPLIRPQTTTIA